MSFRQFICAVSGCAALLTLPACAYDPYYHPLAAHPYYDAPVYAGPAPVYQSDVYVVHGPGPHRYYDNHWRDWHDRGDWDDRYYGR